MRSLPILLENEIAKAAQYGTYLLQIDFDTPLRYTALDISIRYDSKTWTPRRFQFSSVETGLSEEIDRMDLTIDNTDHSLTSLFHDQPVRRKLVWLWYIGLTYPATPIGVSLVYNGQIDGVEIDQSNIKMEVLSALAYWRKRVPGRIYQATCPWVYEPLLSATDPRYMKYCRHVPTELIPDPSFDNAPAWTCDPVWTVHDGKAWKTAGAGSIVAVCPGSVGTKYTLVYTIDTLSGGAVWPVIGGVAGTHRTTAGTYTEEITAGGPGSFTFNGDAATVCSISLASVKIIWCDQSYKRCHDLGNEDNFGGFRYLPYLLNRTFKWGPEKMS